MFKLFEEIVGVKFYHVGNKVPELIYSTKFAVDVLNLLTGISPFDKLSFEYGILPASIAFVI